MAMTKTRKCWRMDYIDHRDDHGNSGPAVVYWLKTDIDKWLRSYSNGVTGESDVTPGTTWNKYSDVGYLVTQIPPYRIIR